MDKQLKKKKWTKQKLTLWVGSPLLLCFTVYFAFSSRTSTYTTPGSKLQTAQVIPGMFQDIAAFQGTVEPIQTIRLDAAEGGVIEEILAEDGMLVDSGQALMRLSNATLRLDFMNRETQIVEQINNLRSTRITLDQNKRQVQEALVDLSYELKEQRRQFTMDSSLYADETISESDYLASAAKLTYLNQKRKLLHERFETDEKYRASQLERIDRSVDMMERNLDAIRRNLENLVVRAPITGQLNSFDHEIGQTKNKGENLGRVDVLDQYIVSALVDQFYLSKIKLDQFAQIRINQQEYKLLVSKIFPTVQNSQFEIQLAFTDSLQAPGIRRGQNIQVQLELSQSKESLLIPRGAFMQTNKGKYVYVIDQESQVAVRRKVTLGNQNPKFIEVLSGLDIGEEIITSTYQNFGEAEELIITE